MTQPGRSTKTKLAAAALVLGMALALGAARTGLAASSAEPQFPERPGGFVNDYSGTLGSAEIAEMENLCVEMADQGLAEMSVVLIETTEPIDINLYAVQLFEKWGIGEKGKDNGLLILAAMRDRRVKVEVGYGLEGILPDQKVGRILDQHLVPAFGAGEHARGLQETLREFAREIEAAGSPGAVTETASRSPFVPLIALAAVSAGTWALVRRRRRCPKCGKPLTVSDRILVAGGPQGPGKAAKVSTCASCGYREERIYQTRSWRYEAEERKGEGVKRKPWIWFGPFGPFGGGGFGGGGFGGGGFRGFGGGRSGGGGAGRGW